MYRKGAQDAKKSRIFAKLGREITVSVKLGGGGDVVTNSRLRLAIAMARAQSMPKDNIDRAIKRGMPGNEGVDYEEMRYEGIGVCQVSFIVEALTDNRNRTASEIKTIFSKNGGALSAVTFNFEHLGYLEYPQEVGDYEAVFEKSVDAGAQDCMLLEGKYGIFCSVDRLGMLREAFVKHYGDPPLCRFIWRPLNVVSLEEDQEMLFFKFLDALEDHEDVQHVYSNVFLGDGVPSMTGA